MNAIPQAPVYAASEIEIAAEADRVWAVLTDFERWPSWNPDVKSMTISGGVAPGTTFTWKSGPATITSRIERVEPPRLIAWTGRTFGTSAIHVYRLDERGDRTLVQTEESFEGWLARLGRGRMAKSLEKTLATGLRHLKTRVERTDASPDSTGPGNASG